MHAQTKVVVGHAHRTRREMSPLRSALQDPRNHVDDLAAVGVQSDSNSRRPSSGVHHHEDLGYSDMQVGGWIGFPQRPGQAQPKQAAFVVHHHAMPHARRCI